MARWSKNGDTIDDSESKNIVTCKKCHKKYTQYTSEQVVDCKQEDFDICPYCKNINGSSMEIEYTNYKISGEE